MLKIILIGGGVLIAVFILFGALLSDHQPSLVQNAEQTTQQAGAEATTSEAIATGQLATTLANSDTVSENVVASRTITTKISDIVAKNYPEFEITIWNKNAHIASEGETPYELVINGRFNKTIASDCDKAKRRAYYMLESFYKDDEIRPTLSRVMITVPYYLRVSLGASDGVPMEEHDNFSGPSNFWDVIEEIGLGENETGEMKDRTWGTYLAKCE